MATSNDTLNKLASHLGLNDTVSVCDTVNVHVALASSHLVFPCFISVVFILHVLHVCGVLLF